MYRISCLVAWVRTTLEGDTASSTLSVADTLAPLSALHYGRRHYYSQSLGIIWVKFHDDHHQYYPYSNICVDFHAQLIYKYKRT